MSGKLFLKQNLKPDYVLISPHLLNLPIGWRKDGMPRYRLATGLAQERLIVDNYRPYAPLSGSSDNTDKRMLKSLRFSWGSLKKVFYKVSLFAWLIPFSYSL